MKLIFNVGYMFETVLFNRYKKSPELAFRKKITDSYIDDNQWGDFISNLYMFKTPEIRQL